MTIDFIGQIKTKLLQELPEGKQRIAAAYLEDLQFKSGLREATFKSRMLSAIPFLKLAKDANRICEDDIKTYLLSLKEAGVTENTLRLRVINLRLFLRFLGKEELIKDYKPRRIKKRLPVDNVLVPEDIKKMLSATKTQRDRAVLMLLWDSAARLGEINSLKIKNVEFDQYGAVVYLPKNEDGQKTGQRRIRLIDSTPDLLAWINMHPLKDDPDAPLFCLRKKGVFMPLSERRIFTLIKQLGKVAEIKKDVSPHKLRHARLTFLSKKGFNEMELRIFAGWADDSTMPAVYLHISGADVEAKSLRIAGVKIQDDTAAIKALEPIKCPRCNKLNPHDAKFCNCSMVLDEKAASSIKNIDNAINIVIQTIMQSDALKEQLKKALLT